MPKNQEYIKKNNIELVLNTLLENKSLSRLEISQLTQLSTTSITRVTQFLIENGFISEEKCQLNKAGRNPVSLFIIPNSAYTVGIEFLKDSIIFSVLNLNREVVLSHKESYNNSEKKIEDLINYSYDKLTQILKLKEISYSKIVGIGIAIPGIVNNKDGIVNFSTQLQWENKNIKDICHSIFNKPIIVENDTKARMIAKENNRAFLKNNCVVGLFIGEGVSAVGISEGFVIRGSNNAAGEVGHIITNSKGIKCDCGSNGCIQTNLAIKFLIEKAKEHNENINDIKEILISYKNNEEWAKNIILEFENSFLLILDILQHCYNPSIIIVSGEIVDSFYDFLNEFIKSLELINKTTSTPIKLIVSKNNENEPSIGVANLSFNLLFKH